MNRFTSDTLGRSLYILRMRVTLLAVLLLGLSGLALAATLPTGFVETQIASGLSGPTTMDIAPDGRIFVLEEGGRVRVIKNNQLLTTPFITLTTNTTGERGVLGIAFDPNFTSNRFVYLYYTATSPTIHNRVSRFTANGDVAVAGSEVQLLNLPTLGSEFHNGGAIHFGNDGKLYIATGDNRVSSNAPSLNSPLGKILRINSDGSIPTDNPFFNQTTGINRAIWARGLRNPFSFAFQPGTGRMFINDVGEASTEEIDDGIAGSNYGWPTCEGACGMTGLRDPIFQYSHSGGACAIVGAAFYNPTNPTFGTGFVGKYFFGDLCAGFIRQLDPATRTASGFATGISQLVDIKVEPSGSLLYLARTGGVVFRVSRTGCNTPPTIGVQPVSQTVSAGATATFSVQASGCGTLSYQWQRANAGSNTFNNIAGATSPSFSLTAAATDNGARFRVVVTNSAGSTTSNAATLTVTTCQPPVATITAPAVGTLYSGGQTINFAGTGTDLEDGTLPASAFTWEVVFHHADHTHPFMQPTTGITSGSFTVPTNIETDSNVFFRIHLTVRDSCGLTRHVTRDVLPRTVNITITSDPVGLQITLDGQPRTTPVSFTGVVGIVRTIGTSSPQTLAGQTWQFSSWSDGGAQTHVISTPTSDTTFTATFQPGGPAPCVTGMPDGTFRNSPFDSQTGMFTAEFDATPSARPINSTIGLSNGPQTAHTGLAAIARFNSSGNIDARNGGAYAANSTIPYSAGVSYHFRLVINAPQHTYSVFVTPAGGSELTVGTNFAFRTEQATVASLNYWSVWVSTTPAGTDTVCDFKISGPTPPQCTTATATSGWQNQVFTSQTGTFTAEFDATPSVSPINSVVGLSQGEQNDYTGFAAIARFNPSGNIDARNGGAYAANSTIPYSAGVTYHFRLVVNVATRTYSIFVTPAGGSEITVGANFAFRSEQSGVTSLNWWGIYVNPGIPGSTTVCNFKVTGDGGGGACSFSISPTSQNFTDAAGTGSVNVSATASNCAWTATSNAGFITITAGSSGAGNGTVSYAVAQNTGGARSGVLTIAGRTFTVNQAAAPTGSAVTFAGVRSSGYGISPFPTQAGWVNAMTTMASYFPGSTPTGVWLVGEVDFASTGQLLEFPRPNDGVNYGPLIIFSSTDKHEPYLDYFDTHGIKVFLQLEPGFADVPTLIDLVLNRYKRHPCVIGLGVDVEWYRNASEGGTNARATDTIVQAWDQKVKSHNPNYQLFVKHFDLASLPSAPFSNVIYINDSQEHGSFTNFLSEMEQFADFYFPNTVGFQFGYETDRTWWSSLATPIPKTIGDRLASQLRSGQNCMNIWVDFTLREVLPSQ
jgi:glucose/arabinose dehydrogenase